MQNGGPQGGGAQVIELKRFVSSLSGYPSGEWPDGGHEVVYRLCPPVRSDANGVLSLPSPRGCSNRSPSFAVGVT